MSAPPSPSPLALLPHQVRTVQWMDEREKEVYKGITGGLVLAEMGLGKTVVGVTKCIGKRNLVVLPKGLINSWRKHIEDWAPDRKVIYFHKDAMSPAHYKNMTFAEMTDADMVVTTYDVVQGADRKSDFAQTEAVSVYGEGRMQDKVVEVKCRRSLTENRDAKGEDLIYAIKWSRVMLDEGHKICNSTTKVFKALMAVYGEKRWILSGTIIRNSANDLWAALRWTGYTGQKSAKGWCDDIYFAEKLNIVVLKMDYKDANIVLPKAHMHDVVYKFSAIEQKVYDTVKKRVIAAFNNMMLGNSNYMTVLALFTRLRQVCVAPYLITPESKRHVTASETAMDEDTVRSLDEATGNLESWVHDGWAAGVNSSRPQKVVEIIKSIPKDEKVIVFSCWTSSLDLVDQACLEAFGEEVGVVMLDGDCSLKQRAEAVERFTNDPSCRILLANSKTAGEGLTLTVANHVVQLESWWNSSSRRQNFSRAYRYPQTKECHMYNLFAEDTIETNMIAEIIAKKDKMEDSFFGENAGTGAKKKDEASGLTREMMGRILNIR